MYVNIKVFVKVILHSVWKQATLCDKNDNKVPENVTEPCVFVFN